MSDRKLLQKVSHDIKPTSFLDARLFLLELYKKAKTIDPTFSYPRMAVALGFKAHGIINQFIRGRRKITLKTAENLSEHLGLRFDERRYFLTLIKFMAAKTADQQQKALERLIEIRQQSSSSKQDAAILEYFSAWYHPVILELIGMSDWQEDAEQIAAKLLPAIKPHQVEESLALLQRINLVKREEDGVLRKREQQVMTPRDIRAHTALSFHTTMIDKAREALANVPAKERVFNGITFAITEAQLEELKVKFHTLLVETLGRYEKVEEDARVYQLNLHLFPLSRKES